MTQGTHLVGIGGSGMSGLARLLLDRGDRVSGSDLLPVTLKGAEIRVGHDAANLPAETQIVVYSPAVAADNPELVAARERGMEVLSYPQMVGRLMAERSGIAVAGTHGKTTTSGLIAFILSRAGLEPTFLCGSTIPQLGSNAGAGKGKFFVAEACEYYRSFLNLAAQCAVITNIEEDHLDYYRDIEDISGAFKEFAGRVGDDGIVIGSLDSPPSAAILREYGSRGETFSLTEDADWRARNIRVVDGRWNFEILKYGKPWGEVRLGLSGEHNVSNALAAAAAATWAGVGQELVLLGLAEYEGAERRMEVVGERNGAIILDDYAHHPTEIQATLRAVKERYPDRRIWCVFQPHLHSRTRQFLKDFARSFADVHLVLLADIYAARNGEKEQRTVSSSTLAKLVDETGKAALYLPSFDELVSFLKDKLTPDCVIITLGAGDIGEVARRLVE